MIVTRFAPSPTGPLHLGHAYSAVLAHDLAHSSPHRAGGRFVLRIDDIDGARSRHEHVDALIADLRWIGLRHDGDPVFQSARLDDYRAALDRLRAQTLLYPCFCTRADIAASMMAPHGPSAAVYPGTCRTLAADDAARRMDGEPHCWRIDMEKAVRIAGELVAVNNGVAVALDALAHGDVVLARKDAPASYHLASTIDDAALGVSDVVRGRDLMPATAVHVLLQRLLGLPTPRYHHHALVVGADGKRLAKRDGAAGLGQLHAQGVDGIALAAALRAHRLPPGYSLSAQ